MEPAASLNISEQDRKDHIMGIPTRSNPPRQEGAVNDATSWDGRSNRAFIASPSLMVVVGATLSIKLSLRIYSIRKPRHSTKESRLGASFQKSHQKDLAIGMVFLLARWPARTETVELPFGTTEETSNQRLWSRDLGPRYCAGFCVRLR